MKTGTKSGGKDSLNPVNPEGAPITQGRTAAIVLKVRVRKAQEPEPSNKEAITIITIPEIAIINPVKTDLVAEPKDLAVAKVPEHRNMVEPDKANRGNIREEEAVDPVSPKMPLQKMSKK